MKSALYAGTVRHERHSTAATGNVAHAFRYPSTQTLLFLDEIDAVMALHPAWSARRPNVVWYRRRDFGGDPAVPLDQSIRDDVAAATGERPTGRIALLGQLRTWGFLFNPLTTYYVYDETEATVRFVILEVRSTPWLERRRYVVRGDESAPSFAKTLHVSPFLGMDHVYRFRWSPPGRTIGLHLENWRGGEHIFDASLTLERTEMSRATMGAALRRRPLATYAVTYGIYRQALTLWRKRAPFFTHPAKLTKESSKNRD